MYAYGIPDKGEVEFPREWQWKKIVEETRAEREDLRSIIHDYSEKLNEVGQMFCMKCTFTTTEHYGCCDTCGGSVVEVKGYEDGRVLLSWAERMKELESLKT